ncbi:MAG: hypothetical protein QM734_11370 [Cyclobacteriaceae bacterium]
MKSLFLFVLVLLVSASDVMSQKDFRSGYIINLAGDTTKGFCLLRFGVANYMGCGFKKNQKDSVEFFLEDRIKGYGFVDGSNYKYEPALKNFAELLSWGKADLLLIKGKFFIHNADGNVTELLNASKTAERDGQPYLYQAKEYLSVLGYLLRDCQKIANKIAQCEFSKKALIKLIDQYNECFEVKKISEKKAERLINISVGTSFLYSQLMISNFDPLTRVDQESNNLVQYAKDFVSLSRLKNISTTSYGFSIQAAPHRMRGKIYFAMEFLFQKIKFNSSITSNYTYSVDQTINLFKTPIYVGYNFKKQNQKIYPFTYFGISVVTANSGDPGSPSVHGNTFHWSDPFQVTPISFLPLGGVGLRAELGKISAQIVFRYETGKGPLSFNYPGSPNPQTHQSYLSGGLGVTYSL